MHKRVCLYIMPCFPLRYGVCLLHTNQHVVVTLGFSLDGRRAKIADRPSKSIIAFNMTA